MLCGETLTGRRIACLPHGQVMLARVTHLAIHSLSHSTLRARRSMAPVTPASPRVDLCFCADNLCAAPNYGGATQFDRDLVSGSHPVLANVWLRVHVA
jgi:hypothetical protein